MDAWDELAVALIGVSLRGSWDSYDEGDGSSEGRGARRVAGAGSPHIKLSPHFLSLTWRFRHRRVAMKMSFAPHRRRSWP